jgi:hypothetical protein
MCFRRLTVLAVVAAAAQLPWAAAAQNGPNLLVNDGFNAGLTGYVASTSPGYVVSAVLDCNLGVTCALFGTPGTGPGFATLSQSVATVPAASYVVSVTTGQKASGAAFAFFLEAGGGRTSFDCLAKLCRKPGLHRDGRKHHLDLRRRRLHAAGWRPIRTERHRS